ncbi:MAG: TolC family protein [Blastochloris sp.]|nr:TolC family protein [Blastochloris sp.]
MGVETLPELKEEKLVAEALSRRPDYQLLKNKQRSLQQQVYLASRELYPQLGFRSRSEIQPGFLDLDSEFNPGRNDNEPNLERQPGNTQLPLSLYLSWTFFDGNRSQGLKQSAQAELITEQEALSALARAIPGEIHEILQHLEAAQINLESLVLSPSAQELRQTAELGFNAGRLRLLDQGQVEDVILQQERQILAARLNFSLSAAALDFSIGRMVEFVPPPR